MGKHERRERDRGDRDSERNPYSKRPRHRDPSPSTSNSYRHHKSRTQTTEEQSDRDYEDKRCHQSQYSSQRPSESRHWTSGNNKDEEEETETNLIHFSFLDHKQELNRILMGIGHRDQLVDDPKDFWLFVNKYEGLLKRSGQSILQEPKANAWDEDAIPSEYNKSFNTNLCLNVPIDEILGRLASTERRTKITNLKVKQFLQIIVLYLDFKQKEKFVKLKKLRKSQRNLPVAQYRNEIIEAVRNEQVVVIAGDTGCGKSTQIAQYLYEAGFQGIVCTQPRRIACISLSKRVAHEMLCEYGTEVGYQIRFERSKSKNTKILFITEGLLLRQLTSDDSLSQYDVLVLDEVHERHLHGDFLLGVAKCLIRGRPDLKLVLMSATINIKLFSEYFAAESARVIEVPGRLYPIKLHYMPQIRDYPNPGQKSKAERLNPEPYIQIMQLIDSKYPKTEKGDLLIFLSGLNEITTIVEAAKEYSEKDSSWIILPLHSSLSIADQDKVFDYAPDGIRKCIISTNIAETSVTIDGIRFVVDSGKVKEMSYDPVTRMQRLKEFWISKASAEQRKGRAGRTGPGICYRLYSEKEWLDLESYSAAEIHRVPLESLLLQMISMGLPNARLFPFIEPPPIERIESAILSLKHHDALTADEKLTSLGKALSKLPVDISIGKMLLMGCVFQQLQPVLTLAAALSVQSPFTNRAYRDHECERARKDLESDHGDPITLLNAYKEWLELKQARFERREHSEDTKKWCRRRGLEEQRFYEITKLRNQFEELLKDCGLVEMVDTSQMTTAERAIRTGEMKQLRDMKRAHKFEAPRKRKLLKSDPWGLGGDDGEEVEETGAIDIRDVEFRMSHDPSKMNHLVTGATACSYKDLMTLKLIVLSGLYPQVAIADEFNYCKSPGQQFFHTQTKPFTCLHPMGYFANNPQILQLTESEIIPKSGAYKSKLPLSPKHQLLCYLTLLETTKPYLMNTLRMPGAQTLLLFAHAIDTNMTFSKIICDSWLCIEFPIPESGQTLMLKASNLRRAWYKLLTKKLTVLTKSAENELTKAQREEDMEELERKLWHDLALFMNTEICYTLKRMLPADLKTIYTGPSDDVELLQPNPFANDFECTPNNIKGGVYITENITYGCVIESDWSIAMANEIVTTDWDCPHCQCMFNVTGMQKLQHVVECAPKASEQQPEEPVYVKIPPNARKYVCPVCKQTLYLSSIEVLKHRKSCK